MLRVVAAVALVIFSTGAGAVEAISFDRACNGLSGGDGGMALRQTIVIVDEAAVSSGPDADLKNLRWKRALLEIADAVEGAQGNMAPRERLKIFLARKDGSELAPIFSGCSPNVSEAQKRKLEEGGSFVDWVFTGGASKVIASNLADYKAALADAIAVVLRFAKDGRADEQGALLQAIATAPRLVDLAVGIPRIILISPFNLSGADSWKGATEARTAGFEVASRVGLDLQRAEVYVVAPKEMPNRYLRAFAETFFLRSRGNLVGWRSEGLPQLLPIPVEVRVFGGTVQMGDVQAPVQVRVAYDAQGTLVNSWVEVTTGRSLATPISGKSICRSKDVCTVQGDGRQMGQAWNPDPKEEPIFDPQFAWSGLRYFEMSYRGAEGSVRIWDPKVSRIQMGDRQVDDFRFDVHGTDKQRF